MRDADKSGMGGPSSVDERADWFIGEDTPVKPTRAQGDSPHVCYSRRAGYLQGITESDRRHTRLSSETAA